MNLRGRGEQVAVGASTSTGYRYMTLSVPPASAGNRVTVDGTRPQAPYPQITRAECEASRNQAVQDGTDKDCANGVWPVR